MNIIYKKTTAWYGEPAFLKLSFICQSVRHALGVKR